MTVERLEQSAERLDAWRKEKASSSWAPVDLAPILAGEAIEERPTVLALEDEFLLYPGRVSSLYGEPEGIKTWLALEACRQEIAAGNVAVYFDFEDSARGLVGRARALGMPDDAIRELFLYVQPQERVEAAGADLEAILERKPTLIVLDGVTEAMTLEGLALEKNAEVAEFYHRLPRRLARCGAAVLMLDHVTKAKDDRGRYAIGAQAKLAGIGGAAYSVTVQAPFGRGRTGRARLLLRKDREGWIPFTGKDRRVAEIEATSDGERVTITLTKPTEGDFRPTTLMERVSRVLEGKSEPSSWYWVRENVSGKNEAKRAALNILHEEGFVEAETGARNAQLYSHVRPYRAADEAGDRSSGQGSTVGAKNGANPQLSPVPLQGGERGGHVERTFPPVPGDTSGTRGGQVPPSSEEMPL